jgi:hypothetical protein
VYSSTRENDMPRKNTNLLLEMVSEGTLDKDALIQACLMWMSEDEVTEMAQRNEFLESDDDVDVDESMDGDHDSAMASAGWGTDEDYGYSGDVDEY